MPRRVWTYMPDQGWDLANMISTIGAISMGIGVIILVFNAIMATIKNERVGNDPWGDGRTLEWAIPSPPPFYNFPQTPLVRGLDSVWLEKMDGNESGFLPAEPVKDIHMPYGSILPFIMTLGLFIAGFGAMFRLEYAWGLPVLVGGLVVTFFAMAARSVRDDLGFYVTKEEVLQTEKEIAQRGHN